MTGQTTPAFRTLDTLRAGEKAVVRGITPTDHRLRNKLLSMGVVAGTTIEVLCFAPLGDPIQIKALGYKLSLRISEASHVRVAPLS